MFCVENSGLKCHKSNISLIRHGRLPHSPYGLARRMQYRSMSAMHALPSVIFIFFKAIIYQLLKPLFYLFTCFFFVSRSSSKNFMNLP